MCFVKVTYGDNIPVIKGNVQRLEQVVINLINNARQALADEQNGVFVLTNYNEKDREVTITVRDEGKGMDKKTLEHITEPFFTTKGPKEGTGLGLSICNRIIKKHGGTLELDSREGKGTTARVILPVIDREGKPA